ncbi:MAG: NAD(P)H-binding protein [Myxococcota bacterium]
MMSRKIGKPTILVTSASGKTGRETALQLLRHGLNVRAFVRRQDARSRLLADAGAEVFVGNQFSLSDMRRAMTGAQRAYHCAPAAPYATHFGAVFLVAAREARLEHIVTLGQWLADPGHTSMATRETWLVERLLTDLPDTTWTINNVGWFADNYFLVLKAAAQLGVLPMPLGPPDFRGNAPPSNRDIGAVNAAALADPAQHAGQTYRPTGPRLVSNEEIARAIGDALGRRVRYMNIPEWMFLRALRAERRGEFIMTQLLTYTRDYRDGAFAVGAPNTDFETATGRPPDDLKTIAASYVNQPEAKRTVANRIGAWLLMSKILFTRTPDVQAIEHLRDHPMIDPMRRAMDLSTWRATHEPQPDATPRLRHDDGRRPQITPLRSATGEAG